MKTSVKSRVSLLSQLWAVVTLFSLLWPCAASRKTHAFVIIGGGPAGLQWGTFLKNAGVDDYIILERNEEAGSFFKQYPRGRKLISANRANMQPDRTEEFALRHDWHSLLEAELFTKAGFSKQYYPNADELVDYLKLVSEDLNIQFNATVESTEYDEQDKVHLVHTAAGTIFAERLIVATGLRIRSVPECVRKEAERQNMQVYTYETFPEVVTNEEDFCHGKRVTVLGNGNAAFETADKIAPCASGVRLIYRHTPRFSYLTHYVGDVRISNAAILDRYKLKSIDEVTAEGEICGDLVNMQSQYREAMSRASRNNRTVKRYQWGHDNYCAEREDECYVHREEFKRHTNQTVIFAGGFTGMRDGLVDLADEKQRYPRVGPFWSDESQPQRFYAGALMHGVDYRQSAGGFIHGFRYNVRAQFRYLMREYNDTPWPTRHFPDLISAFRHSVVRIQNSSGLYQMSDFLVDAITANDDGSATYWYELPKPWIAEVAPSVAQEGYTIHFEYSNKQDWYPELMWEPSRISRNPALYLHPVVTPFYKGAQLEAVHVTESLLGSWDDEFAVADTHFVLLLAMERVAAARMGASMASIDLEERVLTRMDEGAFACDAAVHQQQCEGCDVCQSRYRYPHPSKQTEQRPPPPHRGRSKKHG